MIICFIQEQGNETREGSLMPGQQTQSAPSKSDNKLPTIDFLCRESQTLPQRFSALAELYISPDVETLLKDIKDKIIDPKVKDRGTDRKNQVLVFRKLLDHYASTVATLTTELKKTKISAEDSRQIHNQLEKIKLLFLGALIHRKQRIIASYEEGVWGAVSRLNFFSSKKSSRKKKPNDKPAAHCDLELAINEVLCIETAEGKTQKLDPHTIMHCYNVFASTMTSVKDDKQPYYLQFPHFADKSKNFLENLDTLIKKAESDLKSTNLESSFRAIYSTQSFVDKIIETQIRGKALIEKLVVTMTDNKIGFEQLISFINSKQERLVIDNKENAVEKEDYYLKLDKVFEHDPLSFKWFSKLFNFNGLRSGKFDDVSKVGEQCILVLDLRTRAAIKAVFVNIHDLIAEDDTSDSLKIALLTSINTKDRNDISQEELRDLNNHFRDWKDVFGVDGVNLTYWNDNPHFFNKQFLKQESVTIAGSSSSYSSSAVACSSR